MLNGIFGKSNIKDPYVGLGLGLTVAGAGLVPIFFFLVDSEPLTAVAISLIMLGLVCVALANTRPAISPEASQMMLEAGMENIAALLEELGLTGKAIYLPSSLRDGRSQALVPIRSEYSEIQIRERIPGRLIVRHGKDPQDIGIAVATPGSICLDGLDVKPGPSSTEIESALSTILVGVLDIAGSVTVTANGNKVNVAVSKPKLAYENVWYFRSLGSPVASIAATAVSEAFNRPVVITQDESQKKKALIELEVLS